jgi:toxin ParE1/3/4
MIVRLRQAAYDDLVAIEDWLKPKSPGAARQVVDQILDEIERLDRFPFLGHAGRVADTREWIVPRLPYIIVYRIDAVLDELHVIGVFHAAQNRDTQKR